MEEDGMLGESLEMIDLVEDGEFEDAVQVQ